ncbi:hypothetical protein HDF16_000832 [Granulicella aggregans]|uniref:Uncharacterized protein n=1 Tax=Granulicella aggregans TaxID=474949 RepID=A0A7W8E1T0_9BACT|nr:hypothetical protein [Granulicella aggregans]
MLLRLQTRSPCSLLAELQKMADLISELSQHLNFGFFETRGQFTNSKSIVTRYKCLTKSGNVRRAPMNIYLIMLFVLPVLGVVGAAAVVHHDRRHGGRRTVSK